MASVVRGLRVCSGCGGGVDVDTIICPRCLMVSQPVNGYARSIVCHGCGRRFMAMVSAKPAPAADACCARCGDGAAPVTMGTAPD